MVEHGGEAYEGGMVVYWMVGVVQASYPGAGIVELGGWSRWWYGGVG